MSHLSVSLLRVEQPVIDHPEADRLSLVPIKDFICVSAKLDDGGHRYSQGDLVAYIPEGSLLPVWLLKRLGMWDEEKQKGKLNGSKGNRAKIIRLRGRNSQGVLYPLGLVDGSYRLTTETGEVDLGPNPENRDVAELLGVVKYEPPVPAHMAGEVVNLFGYTVGYDIENIQRFPGVLVEGETVIFSEKLHGTCCTLASYPELDHPELFDGHLFAYSKGLGAKGLVFKHNEANQHNIYHQELLRQASQLDLARERSGPEEQTPMFVMGELYGKGVQDLEYGEKGRKFRVFDVYVGKPGQGRFLDEPELLDFCHGVFETVSKLYEGPFIKDELPDYRDGLTTINGQMHLREGIVIRPSQERRDPELGRVILKAVSPDYLLRKNKNATEYN